MTRGAAARSGEVALRMAWPPSLNRLWRVFGGRVVLSRAARAYTRAAAAYLPAGRVRPLTGRLQVWIVLNPPAKLARGGQPWDIANREKLLCDVLTKQRVWLDDSQIDMLVMSRGIAGGAGSVDVLIREL